MKKRQNYRKLRPRKITKVGQVIKNFIANFRGDDVILITKKELSDWAMELFRIVKPIKPKKNQNENIQTN